MKYCLDDPAHDVQPWDEECPECESEIVDISDEMSIFQERMLGKWITGRAKYKALGKKTYNEDSIAQAQEEVIDLANYAMRIYWELEDIKQKIIEIARKIMNPTTVNIEDL